MVVLDVKQPGQPAAATGHKRRRNRGKKRNNNHTVAGFTEPALSDEECELQQQVPLEMGPLVQAAIDYGRRTHAMGALSAANVLARIASKLRITLGDISEPVLRSELLTVIGEAETTSRAIFNKFSSAYETDQDAPA